MTILDPETGSQPGVLKEFVEFIDTRVEPIPGWLHVQSALFTAHMVRAQHAMGIGGPTLEIGVFKGKYLAVLYELSQPDEIVVGVDLFVGSPNPADEVPGVRSNIASACGGASRLKIVVADSLRLTGEAVLAESGGQRYRFVSVDGGHTAPVVFHDLETALGGLREGGIMALDDVYNPLTPGVMEGVADFFIRRKPALAPFAYCYNKLYATTPGHHARYLGECRAFLDQNPWLRMRRYTLENAEANRAMGFTPALFGHEIFVFLG